MASQDARSAENQVRIRRANERLNERVTAMLLGARHIPFLCECAEPSCTTIVRLPLAEYERIRADPTWFFNATGHSAVAGPWATPVESHPGYEVVVKRGVAAEVVKEADPRSRT